MRGIGRSLIFSLALTGRFVCAQTVLNGDFENVTIGPPYISSNASQVPGWTRSGALGDGLLVRVGYSDTDGTVTGAGHGSQFVILGGGQPGPGTASWTTTVTNLTPSATYTLSFMIANEGEAPSQSITVSLPAGSSTGSQTFSTTPITPGPGQSYWKSWETKTMPFVATATSATLQFSTINQRFDIGLDYVQVTQQGGGGGPLPTVTTVQLSKSDSVSCAVPASASSFQTTDLEIWVYLSVTNATANGVLRIDWVDPSGAVAFSDPFQPLTSSGSFCFTDYLSTASDPHPPIAGNWTVRFYWNGSLLTMLPLPITAAGGGGGTNFTGTYICTFGPFSSGPVTLTQTGTSVTGTLPNGGSVFGTVTVITITITLTGTWTSSLGTGSITLTWDGTTITGSWTRTSGSGDPGGASATGTTGTVTGTKNAGGGGSGGTCGINITSDTSSDTAANLTAEGAADWMFIGIGVPANNCPAGALQGTLSCSAVERKSGVTPLIGNLEMFSLPNTPSGYPYVNYFSGTRPLTWTDGTAPVPSAVGSAAAASGIYIEGGGFRITVPADTTARTLTLHVGAATTRTTATLIAHMTDSAVPDQTVAGFINKGNITFKIVYQATQPDKKLTVTFQMDKFDTENLNFSAAALSIGGTVTGASCRGSGGGGGGGLPTTCNAPSGGQGDYVLSRIEVVRTSPQDFLRASPPMLDPLNQTLGVSACSFRLGWDFMWGGAQPLTGPNQNRSFAQVNLTQSPARVQPGSTTVFAANMAGQWTTSGYGVARDHTIKLDGAAGSNMFTNVGDATGTQSGQFTTTNSATVPQPTGIEIAMPLNATIRFGDDHVSTAAIRLIYTGSPVGGQTGCSYDVRPVSLNDPTGGGLSGVFLISTAPGCTWTTTVPVPWVTLSPISGTGPGGVGYSVAANTTGAPRNTTLTVATAPITVQQGAGSSCTYSLDSSNKALPGFQSGFGVTVTVSGSGCAPWTVSIPSSLPWVHPGSGSSFSGSNTATFVVDPNPGPLPRSGTVTFNTPAGTKTVTLTQDAPPCTYSLSPLSSPIIDSSGTTGSGLSTRVTVTGAVCAWSVVPSDVNSQWVHITSAVSATGSGDINFTADANNTTSPRSVVLNITGKNPSTTILYTINQAPAAQNTGPVPVISPGGVVNAASFIPANLPGGAIAQGSFFSIFGTRLGPTPSVQADSYPLGLSLGDVTVKITQGSISVNAIPVFAAQFQVNAVMPSNAPTGDVQVTVTFNGGTSAPAAAKVVVSNFGAFAVSGGRGPGIVQNVVSQTLRPLNASSAAAMPGQYVTLWGTGLGPLPNGASDTQPPAAGILPIPVKVFVGGKTADSKAQFFYNGRGPGLAGIDQFNFQVPSDVPSGCYVPVQVQVADTFYSNTVSMAISSDGSPCNDQNPLSTRSRTGGKNGSVTLIRLNLTDPSSNAGTGSIDLGMAGFSQKAAGGDLGFDLYSSLPPVNSCTYYNNLEVLNGVLGLQLPSQGSPDSIDAGSSITVKGAKGAKGIPYSDASTAKSPYLGLFGGSGPVGMLAPGGPYLDPGSYAISGLGGKDVGPFSFTMNVPGGATWTNRDQISTIDRAQPLTMNWTGGDPATQVGLILGFSTNPNTKVSGGFACLVPLDSGSFTVQPGNMANLPSGTNTGSSKSKLLFITVPRADQAVKFSTSAAPNLDNGFGLYAVGDLRSVTFR